jgi:hypothetical protein
MSEWFRGETVGNGKELVENMAVSRFACEPERQVQGRGPAGNCSNCQVGVRYDEIEFPRSGGPAANPRVATASEIAADPANGSTSRSNSAGM